MRHLLVLAATATLVLTGCSGGNDNTSSGDDSAGGTAESSEGGGEFCDVLLADTSTSATVFASPQLTDEGVDAENTAARLEIIDQIEALPDDLEDDLEIWRDYLELISTADEVQTVFTADTEEVQAAREALFDTYVNDCL